LNLVGETQLKTETARKGLAYGQLAPFTHDRRGRPRWPEWYLALPLDDPVKESLDIRELLHRNIKQGDPDADGATAKSNLDARSNSRALRNAELLLIPNLNQQVSELPAGKPRHLGVAQ
jgi:hypothetical protein